MSQIGPTTVEQSISQVSLYPKTMSYYSRRLAGYSKNTVRLNLAGSTTVSQNGIISVVLPTNSMVDLNSLAMFFKCDPVPSGNATGTTNPSCIFPRFSTSLIERVQVSVGGVSVGNAPNMQSAISYLKQISSMSDDKCSSCPHLWASPQGYSYSDGAAANATARGGSGTGGAAPAAILTAEVSQDMGQNNPTNGASAPSSANFVPTAGNFPDESHYSIELFNGFVSESAPKVLDTSTLGAIRLDILLSPAAVFQGMGAATTGAGPPVNPWTPGVQCQVDSYSLKDIFFYVDVISVADGVYNASVASYLQSGNTLKIPFANYFLFTDGIATGSGFNSALRVNVRSQNIRRVWNSFRLANYNKGGAAAVSVLDKANTTPYFQFGSAQIAALQSIQLQVNNVQIPSQPLLMGGENTYQNRKSLNKINNQLGANLADQMIGQENRHDMFYSVISLDDRLANGLRQLSGFSSAGTQTSIYVNTANTATAVAAALQHLCFVECTSLLMVGQNRQITVIS